jgi:hypothetical protein
MLPNGGIALPFRVFDLQGTACRSREMHCISHPECRFPANTAVELFLDSHSALSRETTNFATAAMSYFG